MRALSVSLIAVALAGVVSLFVVDDGDGPGRIGAEGGDASTGEGDDTVPGPVAEVLEVSCGALGEAVEVAGRRVRARPDGVLVRVARLPGDGTSVEVSQLGESGVPSARGRVVEGAYDTGDVVLDRVAPGRALVRCYPDEGPRHMMSAEEDRESVEIEIVDPGGHFRGAHPLECTTDLRQNTVIDYAAPVGPQAEDGDRAVSALSEAAVRADLLVVPGDGVRIAGYPNARNRVAEITRDGRVVIVAGYRIQGGAWILGGYEACGDV